MRKLGDVENSRQGAETIFSRVLVGIDGSPESLDAARQASVLANPGVTLTLLTAWNVAPAIFAPLSMVPAYESNQSTARSEAEDALMRVQEQLPSTNARLVHGFPLQALIDEIKRAHSTLVAVGSGGHGRAAGILFDSTATALVRHAPCSVLVTRKAREGFAGRITVGVDGSTQSEPAYAAARHLVERFGGELNVVVAEGSTSVDLAGVSLVAGDGFHVIEGDPVRVLAAASLDADLLLLGSRSLRGLKSLGSVSERVVHRAACSTLIVRAS